ncbi:hypothetical protein ACFL6C_09810 [Myxococcota bacterium]
MIRSSTVAVVSILSAGLALHGCDTVVVDLSETDGASQADGSPTDSEPGDMAGDPPGDPTVTCHCRRYCRDSGECTNPPSTCDAGSCQLGETTCFSVVGCQAGEACLVDGTADACE